jgi:cysteine desulfurase
LFWITMQNAIYMDHNATAPVRPEVVQAVTAALGLTGNASSVHGAGRAARCLIEDAREAVACLASAAPAGVIFTSGGTEANAIALLGSSRKRLLVSAIEHPSILAAASEAEIIPVTSAGVIDLAALEEMLARTSEPALVSVMAANNETGVIQPVEAIARLAHAAGALFHCDTVQAAGRIAIDLDLLGADMISLSAHKIGGPQGVGALVLAQGTDISAVLRGGGQERGRRAGTENLPGIAGFGAAATAALDEVEAGAAAMQLRDQLEERIAALAPEARFFGAGAPRLPNTSCFAVPGLAAETLLMAFDLEGIALSSGSACSSGKVGKSHVLAAMGAGAAELAAAIRVSLGRGNTADHVGRFADVLAQFLNRTGARRILAAA